VKEKRYPLLHPPPPEGRGRMKVFLFLPMPKEEGGLKFFPPHLKEGENICFLFFLLL